MYIWLVIFDLLFSCDGPPRANERYVNTLWTSYDMFQRQCFKIEWRSHLTLGWVYQPPEWPITAQSQSIVGRSINECTLKSHVSVRSYMSRYQILSLRFKSSHSTLECVRFDWAPLWPIYYLESSSPSLLKSHIPSFINCPSFFFASLPLLSVFYSRIFRFQFYFFFSILFFSLFLLLLFFLFNSILEID